MEKLNFQWDRILRPIEEPRIGPLEVSILDFDGRGDGQSLNTEAFQKAVDHLSRNGGGRLVIPMGRYVTGSVLLKSGVEIFLEKGAVILGSLDRKDYKKQGRWFALFLGNGQNDLAITGEGTIDGRGQELALNINRQYHRGEFDRSDFHYVHRRHRPSERERPQIIEMQHCSRVKIAGITLCHASCWVQTYLFCTDVVLDRLWVDSDVFWNNDGIDIENCQDVRVSNCDINVADDGVCLKSPPGGQNERILIENNRIRSSASAVKFGTDSQGGFRQILIRNITVFDTYRSAVALESVDGGILEDVEVRDIAVRNTGNVLFIRLGNRNPEEGPGSCRNILIRNIKAQVSFGRSDSAYNQRGPGLWFFHNPIPASITGIPGYPVENIQLENLEIQYPGRGTKGMACIETDRLSAVPEQEQEYPEYTMFEELPSWGLYCRHVRGLVLDSLVLRLADQDFRPALVLDDIHEAALEGVDFPRNRETGDIILREVKELSLAGSLGRAAREVT